VDGQDSIVVPFVWKSDSGITVTKTLTFYRSIYEVDVAYEISNGSAADWTVNQYRQLKRKPDTKDEKQQFMNTYIGGVVSNEEDRYTKVTFGDMEDEDLNVSTTDGWVAMIQHYFATAWIPQVGEQNTAYSRYLPQENRYLIGMVSASQVIPAGAQGSFSTKAYIGPKIQDTLSAAAPHLELTVDFGWLTIIAQPLFWLLKTIHGFVGNWGWAIIFTTFVIKAVFYKLSEASYRSMARMKLLQPKLASLKERHGDDRTKMGQATMELYKKEKVNPLGGCLPMIIQMPVFIALYWTLMESVELRQAPFMLWIQDLSIKDPLFILPVIMAATMYFQQKLNPAPVDPIQAKVFQFLPLIFGIFFAFFPAGLVLYWVVNNSLSIAQQYYITRHVLADSTKSSKKPNLKKS
ncbi:MAG: YidC/Oxa1 family membrane protein insertase, partial [Halioglobus sp.]